MISRARHKQLFYMEMAKLLEAGFDIRKAAVVLTDTKLPAPQAALLKDLHAGLESGQSIAEAFATDRQNITELERNIIGAGERGGKLAAAFQHLASYFGMIATTQDAAIRALIYPLVVLHFGIVLAVVPPAMMKETPLPEMFMQLGLTLLVVYLVAAVLVLVVRAILKRAPENAAIDRLVNRIPWIGKARKNLAMARFCKVYQSCLLAGISMAETVRLASDAAQSGVIREVGTRLAVATKAGDALGPRFMAESAFPKAFARSYATGEEAGSLDKDMANWANVFQADAELAARTASVVLPKLLYFLILLFVAWRIVGFFLGYYEQLDHMGD